MWDLHGPRIESVSPALHGRLLTTGPLEKPQILVFLKHKVAEVIRAHNDLGNKMIVPPNLDELTYHWIPQGYLWIKSGHLAEGEE